MIDMTSLSSTDITELIEKLEKEKTRRANAERQKRIDALREKYGVRCVHDYHGLPQFRWRVCAEKWEEAGGNNVNLDYLETQMNMELA